MTTYVFESEGCTMLEKNGQFFLTLQYILRYEKISSDDLNSTLCYAALMLSYGQLTCTHPTSYWAVWYQRKWSNKLVVTSPCGNRCKALSTQNTCLVNIILLVAEIITDNWRCFSFWHQVFVFLQFSLLLIFQCCYQQLTPCAGAWSASAHWLRTNMIGGLLRMQSLHAQCVSGTMKLDEFTCLLHGRLWYDCSAHVHCHDDTQTMYRVALMRMKDKSIGLFKEWAGKGFKYIGYHITKHSLKNPVCFASITKPTNT